MNLTKNDLVACHRLANSNRGMVKVLNRKHAEEIMNNKSILKGVNFLDISNIVKASNTTDNIGEKISVNLAGNTRRRNPRIYIKYSLCPYCRFLISQSLRNDAGRSHS